jgi:hypothetical protein
MGRFRSCPVLLRRRGEVSPFRRRLRFEPLEERRLLAITVNTLIDEADGSIVDGDISLRDAIAAAMPGEVINFSVVGEIGLIGNRLSIGTSLTIQGPGANLLSIRPASTTEEIGILSVGNGNASLIDVELSGLTLLGGSPPPIGAHGGAIENSENLTILACVINGNRAGATTGDAKGGGIYSAFGSLTVIDSLISGNHADGGGGIFLQSGSLIAIGSTIANNTTSYYGAGIRASGGAAITVTGCTISGNIVTLSGGGIDATGDVTVTDSMITDNRAGSGSVGGGISATGAGLVSVTNSTIRGNSAGSGGGIYRSNGSLNVTGSTLEANTATNGGGIFADSATAIVSDSRLSGNIVTSQGGGIYGHNGQLTIRDCTLVGNMASYGGGLLGRSNTMTIERSTISGNQSPHSNGGGIELVFATLNLTNSTISGNTSGSGGGVLCYFSTATIKHSTITGNYASVAGGGIRVLGTGSMTLEHTIVAANLLGAALSDVWGAATAGYSLIGVDTDASITDVMGTSQIGSDGSPILPMLAPLADNGGPTMTHAPLAGSPAIDAGDPNFNPADPDGNPLTDDALPYDQRGAPFVRVIDGNGAGGAQIDIGAVEFVPTEVLHTLFGDYNQDGTVNSADYTVWRNTVHNGVAAYHGADGSGNSVVDIDDFHVWKSHYGRTVPVIGSGGGSLVLQAGGHGGLGAVTDGDSENDRMEGSVAPVSEEITPPLAPPHQGEGGNPGAVLIVGDLTRTVGAKTLTPTLSQRERAFDANGEALLALFGAQRVAVPFDAKRGDEFEISRESEDVESEAAIEGFDAAFDLLAARVS